MKKLLFAFATLLFVACGNKVAQPELVEEAPLPEFELLSTEEPRVSADGDISPDQNLVYNIEIDHPLKKDSLEHIQDYFIKKGEADFKGVNKIIVRAYLKGITVHGTPYAYLNLVAGKKEVIINEIEQEIKELSKETATKQEQVQEVADPLVGTYFCNRTHDTYVFKSDKTGFFTIQGGSPSTFTWKRSGNNVTIVYEVFGQQKLKFDPKAETLTEKSESFGILTFYKQ